jgi:hypothetical protein
MAHPEQEAASPPTSMAEKAAAFEDYLFEEGDPFEEAPPVPAEEAGEDEFDDDLTDEEGEEVEDEVDEADEQAEPAIDPPVSLNAEEKEVFAQLPPEAQQAWAASETRRNAQVQEATTKAKDAQRQAEQAAAAADRQAEAEYRHRLDEIVKVFEPQLPDPANFTDIGQYQRAKAQYDYAKAQHDTFAQQVASIGVETPEQKQARIRARDAELLTIPEIANEATRDEFIRSAFGVASEFGYEADELAEIMEPRDLKLLAQAAKWKADSEELTRIKAKSTERRRDVKTGKFRAMKPGSAPQVGNKAAKSFERTKAALSNPRGNRQARDEAAADWLEASGYL